MHKSPLRSPAEIVDFALKPIPELMIHTSNLPATAYDLRDLLATAPALFERGVPVRVVFQANAAVPAAIPLTRNSVVMQAHGLCQPVKSTPNGEIVPTTLPDRLASMYLDAIGEWKLRPLDGISLSPLLSDDGGVQCVEGYDGETRLWCCRPPTLTIPARPSQGEAATALRAIRITFRTFPFADAVRMSDPALGVEVVDITERPGRDESAFLVALLTACCRSSLWLAPGFVLTAPTISGAGCGKGLLVRAACMIAFGVRPRAFTAGHNRDELEKRLAAEFVQAQPAVFLDNANGLAVRSDTLASVMTERPAGVRILGETRMVELHSTSFVALTGNGLTLSEDLARRFVVCELDARCEDPESRAFATGFLENIKSRRTELLTAMLTIWRWGRQNAITKGKPLGSFEQWAEWCRDPLLTLGCCDPVERIEILKARDPKRLQVVEMFECWWGHHGENCIALSQLGEPVRTIIDPLNRGRQYVASFVAGRVGTNAGGFVLTRQAGSGRWGKSTYALKKNEGPETAGHRAHRGHRADEPTDHTAGVRQMASSTPIPPMTPMPDEVDDDAVPPGAEAAL